MMKVSENSIRTAADAGGMGFQPMPHPQDADATKSYAAESAPGQRRGGRATTYRRGHNMISGFTLAEVLVASTISGFIAIVAVGAMNAVSRTAQTVNRVSEVNAEIRFAARMISRDLANLYRDPNPENVKLIGASQGSETTGPPFLTFYTVGRAKARTDQPEGDVYEVEYFLGNLQDQGGGMTASDEQMVLFRRLWPNPDKEREPGGILTPIAENIAVFYIRFSDGQEWTDRWTEEMRTLPRLIEVTLGTATPEKGDPVLETFTITFPRMAEASAGASPQQGQSSEGQQEGRESTEAPSSQQSSPQNSGNANPAPDNQGNQGRRGPQP